MSYGRGSGQQSVTCYPSSDNNGGYWVVSGAKDAPCNPGARVTNGQLLRLQHSTTRRWLHSHRFPSPITGQQEVSAFGSDDVSDAGDVWMIEWWDGSDFWYQDSWVRFKHIDTNVYLRANAHARFGHPIPNHAEVSGVAGLANEGTWYAAEGVYFPSPEEKAATPGGDAADRAADGDATQEGGGAAADEL